HKRKVLISNLETIAPRERLQTIFADLKISEKIRAEDLQIGDWKKIALKIAK
ncbi:TPA: 16S rRNA (adenine(1518)-N(6)/adenine(1519)-N(6))-dimethyltransferase, partial [Candidatus Taylorbacteria bacterium]|nr:16S rRNA (adenine(1518)-N(6)/adenine(1519)-N(6))-dimethyltransferase [Candidatus Taylorbacteria bacterium]